MNRQKIIRFARYILATLALCVLCACGAANGAPVIEPETVNAELDALRELGLFHAEFEVTAENCAEAQPVDKGDLRGNITINGNSESFRYSVIFDPDMGKITGLGISANVQEDWEPSDAGVYGNYDAIMDPEMTIGEYCLYWAQYRKYSGCELPEGVDGDERCIDAGSLDAWQDGPDATGLRVRFSFTRDGEVAKEDAWICCVPMSSGPYTTFGDYHLVG